jgi:hypothetical protein
MKRHISKHDTKAQSPTLQRHTGAPEKRCGCSMHAWTRSCLIGLRALNAVSSGLEGWNRCSVRCTYNIQQGKFYKLVSTVCWVICRERFIEWLACMLGASLPICTSWWVLSSTLVPSSTYQAPWYYQAFGQARKFWGRMHIGSTIAHPFVLCVPAPRFIFACVQALA